MKQKHQIKHLLLFLCIFTLLMFVKTEKVQAYQADENISITNITSTSATIDWSQVGTYVQTNYEGSTITGYDVLLGDVQYVNKGTNTSLTLTNIAPNTMHFVYIYVYYTDKWGYADSYYTFDYFETGSNANINDGTHNVTNDTMQNITLSTPTVERVEVVDGTVYVKAKNVDPNTYKLEWAIYDKKTKKIVKEDTSYSTADYIYGLNKRKVYYAICRAVSYDSNYNEIYSNWSSKKYFVSQPKITTKSKNIKVNSIGIKWKKVPGAKNYTIYAKKEKSKKWVKIKTTKKNSYTLTKIKGKKINLKKCDYNFKVITNAKVGKKTIKSSGKEYYQAYVY